MKSLAAFFVASLTLVAYAQDDYRFKKDTVMPVRMDSEVTVKGSRVGDRFQATIVQEGHDLPSGTKLLGFIKRIDQQNGRPFVELAFDEAALPAGRRLRIDAVPVPWKESNFRQGKDGRFTAKKGFGKKDDAVVAGLLGGLALGALLKKPFEGAFVGAIAGIIVAEAGAHAEGNLVISAGTQMGALFIKGVDSRTDLWLKDEEKEEPVVDRPSRGWPGSDKAPLGELRYDGKALRIGDAEKPYLADGEWMVPLWAVADQTGIEVDQNGQLYHLTSDEGTLRFEQGQGDYRLNGKRGSFKVKVAKKDRVVYVPMEAFKLLGRDRLEIAN